MKMTRAESRAWAKEQIDAFEFSYDETGNPLCVWRAISLALEYEHPFPIWVTHYLGRASNEFMVLWSSPSPPTKGKVHQAIIKVLGFKTTGRVNHFTSGKKSSHEFSIACAIYDCEAENRRKKRRLPTLAALYREAAIAHASTCPTCRKPPSVGLVEKCWLKQQRFFSDRAKRGPKDRGKRIKFQHELTEAREALERAKDDAKRRSRRWNG